MPLYDPVFMQRKAASAVSAPVARRAPRSPYEAIHGTPDPAVVGDVDIRTGRRMSPNVVMDSSMSNTFRPEDALAAVDQRIQQAQGLTQLEQIQGRLDRQAGGALYSSQGDRMTVPAALAAAAAQRRAREMQQPNVAAQARGGVSGRAMPNTSGSRLLDIIGTAQGNQDLRGTAGIANRFVQMGGRRTVEARAGRAATLLDLVGREQAANQAMGQTRLEQATQLELARENTRGRTMSAIGNMGALAPGQRAAADTNGDGQLSVKERVQYAKQLADLESNTFDDNNQQRTLRPGETVLERTLREALNLDGNEDGGNGFDGGPFPGETDMVVKRPGVTQLPREAALAPSQAYVDRLKQLRDNPEAVAAFERRFGAGSAAQYLQ